MQRTKRTQKTETIQWAKITTDLAVKNTMSYKSLKLIGLKVGTVRATYKAFSPING